MKSKYSKRGSSRKRTASSKRSTTSLGSRPWRTYNAAKALWRPLNPFSDSFVHSFRRMGAPVVLTNDGSNFPALYSDQAQTSFFLGPAVSEPVPAAPSGQAQFPMTFTATLDNVIAYQEFTALFNEYRIAKVELHIEMLNAPAYQFAPSTAPAPFLPEVFFRYDPNDDTVPPNFLDLAQSGNVTSHGFANGNSVTKSCIPRPAMAMYTSVLANAYATPPKGIWMDTTAPSSTAKYYAWKMFWRNWNFQGGTGIQFRLTPMYYLDFRRAR